MKKLTLKKMRSLFGQRLTVRPVAHIKNGSVELKAFDAFGAEYAFLQLADDIYVVSRYNVVVGVIDRKAMAELLADALI